jgi:hypothetical protein
LLDTITSVAEEHGHMMSMKRFLHCCDMTAAQKQIITS